MALQAGADRTRAAAEKELQMAEEAVAPNPAIPVAVAAGVVAGRVMAAVRATRAQTAPRRPVQAAVAVAVRTNIIRAHREAAEAVPAFSEETVGLEETVEMVPDWVQGVLEVPALILQRLLVVTGYIKPVVETVAVAAAADMRAAAANSKLFGPVPQDNSHQQT